MRSRPIGTPLSEEEAATVARFDAAPDAEESLRMRVACALWAEDGDEWYPSMYLRLADAAIAVMRGDDA
jgi:hypothetical protein